MKQKSADASVSIMIIMSLLDRDAVLPTEHISIETIEQYGYAWMSRHSREWPAVAEDPRLDVTDMISRLLPNGLSAIDDLVDGLLSVAMSILDTIEYTQSTLGLMNMLNGSLDMADISIVNPVRQLVSHVPKDRMDGVKAVGEHIAQSRVPEFQMEVDHMMAIISAIRVLCIIKDVSELNPISVNRGQSTAILNEIFENGSVPMSDSKVDISTLLDEDGNYRYADREPHDQEDEPTDSK